MHFISTTGSTETKRKKGQKVNIYKIVTGFQFAQDTNEYYYNLQI